MKRSCTLISVWDTCTVHWKKENLETKTAGWKYIYKKNILEGGGGYSISHLKKEVANMCKLYWSC